MNQELASAQVLDLLNRRSSLCGSTIQELNLSGKSIDVYADFSHATFKGDCILEGCNFYSGATFLGAEFQRKFNADYALFNSTSYFWRARFSGKASFKECRIVKGNQAKGNLLNGEINFSWAHFKDDCDFFRLNAAGPAYFYRTLFSSDVNFREAKFSERVLFDRT